MQCPACETDLVQTDTYGTGRPESFYGTAANGIHYPSTWQKAGDIYRCVNEDCDSFEESFYTDSSGELHEGYPC